jgi:transcriptional regulator with XRE-family HTH domain
MQRAILIALGDRIRALREQRKWSQEEFADRCGLHRTAVGLLERAERLPRLDTLLTISKGLGITVSELLLGLEKRSQSTARRGMLRGRS